MLHRSGVVLCVKGAAKPRHPSKKTAMLTDVKVICLRNQELRSGLRETRKTKCSATIATAAQWEHWQVHNIDRSAREGREITQHVKLARCSTAPVPVCVVFCPLEFEHHRMRDQRSDYGVRGSLENVPFLSKKCQLLATRLTQSRWLHLLIEPHVSAWPDGSSDFLQVWLKST